MKTSPTGWVVAEALATSFTLTTVTGEQSYADRHEKLCVHADTFFIDHARLVAPQAQPAYQATLLRTLADITSFAEAVKQRSSSAAVPVARIAS